MFVALATVPTSNVYPSGLALATNSEPIFDPPPGLFSTMIGWPNSFSSFDATTRAKMSVGPPAAKLTIKRIGWEGYAVWLMTCVVTNAPRQAKKILFPIDRQAEEVPILSLHIFKLFCLD